MNRPYTVNNYPEGEFMSQGGSLTAAQAYQVLKRSEYGADYSFDWMVALGLVGNGGVAIPGDYIRFIPPDYASRARELLLSR